METFAIILLCTLLLLLIVFGVSIIYSKLLHLVTVDVFNEKITRPYKVLLLSDLHNHSFGLNNERLISLINETKADYITIAGDLLIDDRDDLSVAESLIDNLSLLKTTIIYVPGNHELKYSMKFPGKYSEYIEYIRKRGVIFLDDERFESDEISFFGYTNKLNQFKKLRKPYKLTSEEITDSINEPDSNKVNFLVTHNPVYFPEYAKWGADHVVAGHLHGGIVRLPLIGGIISPQTLLFPKYDFGTYYIGKASMTVSAGLGVHTLPIRLFNRPDVTLINLKPSERV